MELTRSTQFNSDQFVRWPMDVDMCEGIGDANFEPAGPMMGPVWTKGLVMYFSPDSIGHAVFNMMFRLY